jgi:Flp pilus assembly protein TadG
MSKFLPPNLLAATIRNLLRLRNDCNGNVAVMMGLLIVPMAGGLGLGFEVSNWYMGKRAMQNAADAAAIAAASNASSNYDVEAKAVTALYGYVDGQNNVTVTASDTATCPTGGNTCYSVTITRLDPLYLSQVVGFSGDTTVSGTKQKSLSSTAIAQQAKVQQPICLLALGTTGTALRTNGAPNSNFSGCTVMSDSAASCNGSNLNANYGLASGTNGGCGNKEYSSIPTVQDPYAYMATNLPQNTCSTYPQEPNNKKSSLPSTNLLNGTLSVTGSLTGAISGTTYTGQAFCGDIQLTGNVVISTPSAGATIVIENGQLDLNGFTLSTANGSAVTVVFSGSNGSYTHAPTDNSTGQGGVLNIQAPSAGPFPGMAIYQDPNVTTGVDLTYKGNNPTWDITGGVYLPNSSVQVSGDVSQSSFGADCFVMIAKNILINGTSNIYQQSPGGAGCKQAGLNMPTATIPGRGALVY